MQSKLTSSRGQAGVLTVFALMGLTIYLAVAFPFALFNLKQSAITEIKSVILVARNGEKTPSLEDYFINEEPPEEIHQLGAEQLTNSGKERMFLLGKFLRMRYYNLLLNGNPRMIEARSSDLDRTLESAQSLLAGLNPPKEPWLWSGTNEMPNWQPKAVHSSAARDDDLLAPEPPCFRLDEVLGQWKNSTRYQQMLNEFRHDLQTLRSNTGLQFEEDLEMASGIEDSLKTRLAFKGDVPSWYTPTFANRLSHIADVTADSRFSSAEMQRLYVGRLLHEISRQVDARIKLDSKLRLLREGADRLVEPGTLQPLVKWSELTESTTSLSTQTPPEIKANNERRRLERDDSQTPKMFVYLTDKQRLAALMSSLQIYSSLPQFGSMLLIELHFEPIDRQYFLRLFTISSNSPIVVPEPLRVNPKACAGSLSSECSPQQFEQNLRHLMLDRGSWLDLCNLQIIRPTTTVTPIVSAATLQPADTVTAATTTTPSTTISATSTRTTESTSNHSQISADITGGTSQVSSFTTTTMSTTDPGLTSAVLSNDASSDKKTETGSTVSDEAALIFGSLVDSSSNPPSADILDQSDSNRTIVELKPVERY